MLIEAGNTTFVTEVDPAGNVVRSFMSTDVIVKDDAGNVIERRQGPSVHVAEKDAPSSLPQIAIAAQVNALTADKAALTATITELRAQLVALKGVPAFKASALIAEFTDDDTAKIIATIADSPDLRDLYRALQLRAVTGDAPIPIDSTTFIAGLAGLKQAVGNARMNAIFTAMDIDLAAGKYIA